MHDGAQRAMTRLAGAARRIKDGDGTRLVRDLTDTTTSRIRTITRVRDLDGRLRMTRMLADSLGGRENDRPGADTAVPVMVAGGREVWLRPRSRDRAAFEFLGEDNHLLPAGATGPVEHVAVFGANIGLLVADLADRYPGARLLAVEPDPDNAELVRRNVAHLGARCTVREAAAWYRAGTLRMGWGREAWGVDLVSGGAPDLHTEDAVEIPAVDAGALLREFTGGAPVDYLLVSVESAWRDLLAHPAWTRDVRCIKVEVPEHHDGAVELLTRAGFDARLDHHRWSTFAVGLREGAAERTNGTLAH